MSLVETQSISSGVFTKKVSGDDEKTNSNNALDYLEPKSQIKREETDVPFTEAETRFVVYPNGLVEVEGNLKFTDLVSIDIKPAMTGFLNFTGNEELTQALAGLTLTLPPEMASKFPFNSTTADLIATYSNDILNLNVNSEIVLPPLAASQYPFNSTDGSVQITYSDGMLNAEVNVDTVLPKSASQQFPFNVTDITLNGSYSLNTLTGTITFSVFPQFTFDDVDVDFTGNRTHLTLTGEAHIIFNATFNGFIIRNEDDLKEKINELKINLPEIAQNITGGLLNVTNIDIDYDLTNGALPGASVTFEIAVQGDFVQTLAYIVAGGRLDELVYSLLDESFSSLNTVSFQLDYSHNTLEASLRLMFAYDLKALIDSITPLPGTLPFIVSSRSMEPTLLYGDVILVVLITDPSEINAAPETGDILVFHKPGDTSMLVVHRAINKTYEEGVWYFTTKGDANISPDPWLVPETHVIGKVVARIPSLGYLWFSSLRIPLRPPQFNEATPIPVAFLIFYVPIYSPALISVAFPFIENGSAQLSYSSVEKRVTFGLSAVIDTNDFLNRTFSWLPKLAPPEVKPLIESLTEIIYASINSAQLSLSYGNGIASFNATVTIEGDLNAEVNHLKTVLIQLVTLQAGYDIVAVPWQLDYINQTKVDITNLKMSTKMNETSFKVGIEGLKLQPPLDVINATHFQLKRFFNLTAPQYSWQTEFPGENQRLKIRVEGGSNATHTVTIFRPETVPPPEKEGLYGEFMEWNNQTLSSLRDLIFIIGAPITGTLTIRTEPVAGEVFVDGKSWGIAPQSREIGVGQYTVSFGPVARYYTPPPRRVEVKADLEEVVVGVYKPINGTLTITTTPISAEVFVNGTSWGLAPQSRKVQIGTYIVRFDDVEGYYTPVNQTVTISENVETIVEGVYEPIPGVKVEEIINPEFVTADNPFLVNATEEASAYLIIHEISDPVTIIVKNVTDPDVDPPPGAWKLLGNYIQIDVMPPDVEVNVTIRIYYTQKQLEALGLDESTLTIYYWDTSRREWIAVKSHINAEEQYVWVNVYHFSVWALMGLPPTPLWNQPTFLAIVIIAVAAMAAITIVITVRRKKSTATS
jgi:signal peptidase I